MEGTSIGRVGRDVVAGRVGRNVDWNGWKGRRLEGTLDPDVVAGRELEGTLDQDVVDGRDVGSGRCRWKGIGRDVDWKGRWIWTLLMEGLDPLVSYDTVVDNCSD